ncbi:MAG: glycosyl hydrolase [Sphingobacteriales bacterium]|nr:glycosyl hydrolase [Sphingobacteriales bacterium]
MIRSITLAGILAVSTFCLSSKNPEPAATKEIANVSKKGKWVKLFDEKTTNGWHTYGKTTVGKCWKIENKTIHLTPVTEKSDRGDLVTDKEYGNYHLQLEWKVAPKCNSGIIFYVHEDPSKFKETYFTGMEMQVLDNIEAEDNKKENHLAGTLYDLLGTAATSKPKPVGEWNKAEIISNNGKLDLILNGITVTSTTLWDDNWKAMVANSKFRTMPAFGTYKTGKIALQYHGGDVSYRNIRIKEL